MAWGKSQIYVGRCVSRSLSLGRTEVPGDLRMELREYRVALVEPAKLSAADQAICIGIIGSGDAVDVESARRELPRATAVAVVHSGNQIVGVGAIKRQRIQYATTISKKSDFAFPAGTLELGYVAVVGPTHWGQGLSHKLVAALLAGRGEALFATTSSEPMKKALLKAGFFCRGQEWCGSHSTLSLWLRDSPVKTSEVVKQ